MGIVMFSHNKFLFFLIACTIANPCFAAGNSGTGRTTFPFLILGSCNCPQNYYVSRCGDMDLDLGTINALVRVKYGIEGNTCWNDSYTDMHYLLHLNGNGSSGYVASTDENKKTISFYNTNASWENNDPCPHKTELSEIRTLDIYKACLNSCVCTKCPNDGVTDSKTNVTTPDSTTFFENFNTIADCYTQSGSDGKGTFIVNGSDTLAISSQNEEHRCYYSE